MSTHIPQPIIDLTNKNKQNSILLASTNAKKSDIKSDNTLQLKKSNTFREKENKDEQIDEDGYENDKNVDEEIKTPVGQLIETNKIN